MKNHTLFLTVFLLTFNLSSIAQQIIVGQHSPTDYYVDIIPDTILNPCMTGVTEYYYIDLNGDGVDDCYIMGACQISPGSSSMVTSIKAIQNTQFVFDKIDTCSIMCPSTYPMIQRLNLNDTVNANSSWTTRSYLYFNYYVFSPTNYCICESGYQVEYLGARIFSNNDTLYAWIKVTAPANGAIIYEHACNMNNIHINNYSKDFLIYPNPARNTLGIENKENIHIVSISITTITGQIINQFDPEKTRLDVSEIASGTYFLKISYEEGEMVKKIIIEH